MPERPPFVVKWQDHLSPDENHYPGHEGELLAYGADFTKLLGLKRLGIWLDVVPPGRRSGYPHAHSEEDEFVFIASGTPDVWIDGHLHRLEPGEAVGFPAGTGIAHSFLNNTDTDVHLLVVGERNRETDDKICYPLHEDLNTIRREKDKYWDTAPTRDLGPHDGKPDALRARENLE